MKVLSYVIISTLLVGMSTGTLIPIFKDLSPIIGEIAHNIHGIIKTFGSTIENTRSSIDQIINDAQNSLHKQIDDVTKILQHKPIDKKKKACADKLQAASKSWSTTFEICQNEENVKTFLSQRLVEFNKFKTQCISVLSNCLKSKSLAVKDCYANEMKKIQSTIEEKGKLFNQQIEQLKTKIHSCVDGCVKTSSTSIKQAINDYNKCIGNC